MCVRRIHQENLITRNSAITLTGAMQRPHAELARVALIFKALKTAEFFVLRKHRHSGPSSIERHELSGMNSGKVNDDNRLASTALNAAGDGFSGTVVGFQSGECLCLC